MSCYPPLVLLGNAARLDLAVVGILLGALDALSPFSSLGRKAGGAAGPDIDNILATVVAQALLLQLYVKALRAAVVATGVATFNVVLATLGQIAGMVVAEALARRLGELVTLLAPICDDNRLTSRLIVDSGALGGRCDLAFVDDGGHGLIGHGLVGLGDSLFGDGGTTLISLGHSLVVSGGRDHVRGSERMVVGFGDALVGGDGGGDVGARASVVGVVGDIGVNQVVFANIVVNRGRTGLFVLLMEVVVTIEGGRVGIERDNVAGGVQDRIVIAGRVHDVALLIPNIGIRGRVGRGNRARDHHAEQETGRRIVLHCRRSLVVYNKWPFTASANSCQFLCLRRFSYLP